MTSNCEGGSCQSLESPLCEKRRHNAYVSWKGMLSEVDFLISMTRYPKRFQTEMNHFPDRYFRNTFTDVK